jgi:hypothetical protein
MEQKAHRWKQMRYEAESTLEEISAAQQAAKRLTAMCLPAITDVLAAQQHDAVTQSYRAQLLDPRDSI